MATISAADVKKLRDRTGLGMMDCKKALEEAGGDLGKAEDILRKQGLKAADLRSGRAAKEGRIGHYIHLNSKIGVLVEINSETDFVARNSDFEQLARDICMHVAATAPKYVSPEEVPEADIRHEREIIAAQAEGKPAQVIEKMIEGKLKDYYKQVCLLEQPFVKDPSMTVKDLVSSAKAKLGENIVVRRFVRFQVGEEA
jgi:elongation factor Ts